MKFSSITELSDFLIREKMSMDDIDIQLTEPAFETSDVEPVTESVEVETELMEVELLTLASSPSMEYVVEDVETNTLCVSKYKTIKDSCGTGQIKLNESVVSLNICDFEDNVSTDIRLRIDGKMFGEVPVNIKESSEEKIIFSRKWLADNVS